MTYLTEDNKDITKRIEQGKTFLFQGTNSKALNDANKKAKETRSYVYEVYGDVTKTRTHIGYAVPK